MVLFKKIMTGENDMKFPTSFICASKSFNTFESFVPAPYLRKSFFADEAVTARLIIGSTGFYEVYLNGKKYTKGALAPYISNASDIIYFDLYELPLQAGENVLGIILGNGFANNPGGHIWKFDKYFYRAAPSVALELTYTCGGKDHRIISDKSFRTAPSPIFFDDYRFGEYYDAGAEQPGWCMPGFDDSAWEPPFTADQPLGERRICEAEPIVVTEELAPVSITAAGDGFVYDFGKNVAGVCRLKIEGSKGQKVEMRFGEHLVDGIPDMKNIWFDREFWEHDKDIVHKDLYICKGEGTETYTPAFTYHGFRYVYVTGITEAQAKKDLLTYLVMNSDLKVRGDFSCSDDTANYLQKITRNSDLANFYYFPTDCPHREKNGWTADAALSCEHLLLNFAPEISYREWMRNICKAQAASGALPGIIPTTGWGFAWGNSPAWDCIIVYLPYFVYLYRGDLSIAKESAANIYKYLKYIESRTDEKGLIHIGLGDWCKPNFPEGEAVAPLEFTDTVISFDIANKSAFLFSLLGMEAERRYAESLAAGYRAAVREHLIDKDTLIAAGDQQTTQAMGLFYEIFEPEERNAAFEHLLEQIERVDGHFTTGVLGARVIFHVLSEFGHSDLAFNMITRPDFPSYGYWVALGATSLWEDFGRDDGLIGSLNHHFWGDISGWFIKNLAGIRLNPSKVNVNEVEIKPSFIPQLQNASGYHIAPAGKISVAWRRLAGGEIELKLEIPENISAKLITNEYFLDGASVTDGIRSGTYILKK